MACHSGNPEMITIAIDCLGKLFTYNYWKFAADLKVESLKTTPPPDKDAVDDGDNDGTSEMITFVIDTICDTFTGESTDEKAQLQIIKVF
jgi:brefeldin A-inhibited guanine nucleotide-exchange protein